MALLFTAAVPLLTREAALPELPNAVLVSEDEMHLAALMGQPPAPAEPSTFGERPTHVPDQYLVRFGRSVANPTAEAAKLVSAYGGGKVLQVYDDAVMKGCNVYIPGITSDRLASHPSVAGVEQEGYCYLCAESTPNGVKRITTGASPQLTRDPARLGLPNVTGTLVRASTTNVVIAVIDTGIDRTHPDLNVTESIGFGYADGNDGNGHGTHVSGTIAAKQGNNLGVVGVFPGASLWSLRVLGPSGSGTYGNVAKALQHVRANANRISAVNMSIGGGYSKMINDLVDACVDAGVPMVVAAGNEGRDARLYTPSSAAKACTVSALVDTDGLHGGRGKTATYGKDDSFATFSNYGAGVDAIAPGVSIVSTLPRARYGSLSGTSMASPHVAGLMGLYRESQVSTSSGTRRATPLEVLSLLVKNTGVELIPGRRDTRTYPLLIGR
jgi:hypothetical protein